MKRLLKATPIAMLILGLMSGLTGTAWASPGNSAVAVVTQDAQVKHQVHFKLTPDPTDTIDERNAAVATADGCTGCRAIAVAVQVVVAPSHPSNITPQNIAISLNQNCSSCESLALAYQFVMLTDGMSHLTAAGQSAVASIRAQVRQVAFSGASLTEISSQVASLMSQLHQTLTTELVRNGADGNVQELRDVDVEDD